MFDQKCACGAPATVVSDGPARCWKCVGEEIKDRRKQILEGKVKWGNWDYNPSNLTIGHKNGYYIDLERCSDSASILDWIAQVSGKSKMFTHEDVGHLVRALDDIIGLQERICGNGTDTDKPFDAKNELKPKS